jgi:hypothetical protein
MSAAWARRARPLLLGVLALGFALGADKERSKKPEAPASGPDVWYAQRIMGGDTPIRVEQLWSKGRKLRSETVVAGYPVLTLVSGEFYYVIDPVKMVGLAVRRSPAALLVDRNKPAERPFGSEGEQLSASGAEKVRSDSLGGQACQVFRLTDERGRQEVWVTDSALRLPLRIDAIDRSSGAHVRTDYVGWLQGELDLPDSYFEPDPRVQLERLEYDEYVKRAAAGPVGPAPVLFRDLLHGR